MFALESVRLSQMDCQVRSLRKMFHYKKFAKKVFNEITEHVAYHNIVLGVLLMAIQSNARFESGYDEKKKSGFYDFS